MFNKIATLFLLVLIATSGVSGYWLGLNKHFVGNLSTNTNSSNISSVDNGIKWNTYVDKIIGYQIEYPSSWHLIRGGPTQSYPDMFRFLPPEENYKRGGNDIGILVFTERTEAKSFNMEGFLDSKIYSQEDSTNRDFYHSPKATSIDGQPGMIAYGGCCMDVGKKAFFINNGIFYTITLYDSSASLEGPYKNEEIFGHMLSSFKVITQNPRTSLWESR